MHTHSFWNEERPIKANLVKALAILNNGLEYSSQPDIWDLAQGNKPVHWAKFSLSVHDWDEPIKRITVEATKNHLPLIHPMIGEKVELDNPMQSVRWWEKIN